MLGRVSSVIRVGSLSLFRGTPSSNSFLRPCSTTTETSTPAAAPEERNVAFSQLLQAAGRVNSGKEFNRLLRAAPLASMSRPSFAPKILTSIRARLPEDTEMVYNELKQLKIPLSEQADGALLQAYLQTEKYEKGMHLYGRMRQQYGLLNIKTFNIALQLFCRTGRLSELEDTLNEIETQNVEATHITYCSVINELRRRGQGKRAVAVYERMVKRGLTVPSQALPIVAHVFAEAGDSEMVASMNDTLAKSDDEIAKNRMADFLLLSHTTRGDMAAAEKLVQMRRMQGPPLTPFCLSYMLMGYAIHKDMLSASRCIHEFKARDGIVSNVKTYNALIQGWIANDIIPEAEEVLKQMRKEGIFPNSHTYTILINAHASRKDIEKVKQMILMMAQDGIKPDRILYTSLIRFFVVVMNDVGRAEEIYRAMAADQILFDDVTLSVLIQGYARNGDWQQCENVMYDGHKLRLNFSLPPYVSLLQAYDTAGVLERIPAAMIKMLYRDRLEPDRRFIFRLQNMYTDAGKHDLRQLLELKGETTPKQALLHYLQAVAPKELQEAQKREETRVSSRRPSHVVVDKMAQMLKPSKAENHSAELAAHEETKLSAFENGGVAQPVSSDSAEKKVVSADEKPTSTASHLPRPVSEVA